MKLLSSLALALTISTAATAEELSIERLAPRQSVVIVGAGNMQRSLERWDRTTLNDVFKLGPFKELSREQIEKEPMAGEFEEMMEELLAELGVDEDPKKIMPTGAAGMAFYLHVDATTGAQRPAMFAFADFGDNAERMQTVIDRMLEHGDENEHVEYEIDDLMDRKLYNITLEPDTGDDEVQKIEQFDPGMDFGPMPDLEQMFEGMKTVHLVRDENVFFMCSETMQLADALMLIDDDASSEFSDIDEVQGVRAQFGDADVYAVALMRPVFRMLGEVNPNMGMVEPMFNMMVGNIKSVGMGMQLDGPDAMVQGTSVVYMPHGKSGITSVLDKTAARGELPTFVGPDTVGFSAVNVDMAGLADFIMTSVRGIPMAQAQMGPQGMEEMERIVGQLTKALGDQFYMVQTLSRPITAESVGQMMAVRTANAQELENLLGELTPQIGMQPRDFLGHRIYSMDAGMAQMMGMPGGGAPAIGVGGGFMFMGMEPAVQQALRSAGQDDLASLNDEDSFNRAVSVLSSDGLIAWGYGDPAQAVHAQLLAQRAAQQQQIEMFREWDPDMAAEMEKEMIDPLKYWDDQDWEDLRALIGPQSWEVRSTEIGFVSKFYQFRGSEESAAE